MDITDLRFREWRTPPGANPSALFTEPLTSGIYVLKFSNGEEYVGETVRFERRLPTQRRRWGDIVAVQFAPAVPEDLKALERLVIQNRASAGVRLRNIKDLNQPLHPSPLDLIVDRQAQEEWLSVTPEADYVEIPEERAKLAARRAASRVKFDQLMAASTAEFVMDSLVAYVSRVIPQPDLTEGRLWVTTAMPSTAKSREQRRLTTLSI